MRYVFFYELPIGAEFIDHLAYDPKNYKKISETEADRLYDTALRKTFVANWKVTVI